MIIAWAVPMSANLLRIFLGDPGSADVTPIGLTLTTGVLYLVVVRGGFADLVPIAREKVFDQLVDAVFVIDAQGDLVDTNAKARSMVGLDAQPTLALGMSLRDACPAIADVADLPGEHDVVCHGKTMVLHIAISNLTDQSGRQLGRVIHARDVTQATTQRRELARTHNELAREAEANEQLRAELADQALRDVGTGLHNRRYIMEVLPGMAAAEASARADAICAACAAVEVSTREGVITLTASAGVAAAAPGNIDALALIDAADAALYRAKRADRNRTWVATPDEPKV